MIGFGVKTALVPLHTWLPDAHSQAPSGISAMLSGVVIRAGLVAMLRALSALVAVSSSWYLILIGIGALNMLVGNLMALQQKQVKRLLAYSSVAQIGYMLLGLGIAFYSGQLDGAQGSLFHLLNHGMMKGLAFLSAGVMLYALHIASGDHAPLLIEDMAGAARRYPVAALDAEPGSARSRRLAAASRFYVQMADLRGGFQTHNPWLEALVIFAALNSVLSLAYYVPLINVMYKLEPSEKVKRGVRMPRIMFVPLLILGIGHRHCWYWPNLMNWLTLPAARVLMANLGG